MRGCIVVSSEDGARYAFIMSRVLKTMCRAAALATACTMNVTQINQSSDLRQNATLGGELASLVYARYGVVDYEWGIKSASTDFGKVTYGMLQPIPPCDPAICLGVRCADVGGCSYPIPSSGILDTDSTGRR